MIIDGKKIAAEILSSVKEQVKALPFVPIFCDVLVGEDPSSTQYVRMKAKTADDIGIKFLQANFPESISTEELVNEIQALNKTPGLCGLIVQLPLPKHIATQQILDAIDPSIDVDCTGTANSGLFYNNQSKLEFPTAKAVMAVLNSTGLDFSGKQFLVIGQGKLVGLPVTKLLKNRGWEVLVADSKTENLASAIKEVDVIISAAGQPGLIKGSAIKPGAIIIDAGTSEQDGGIVGDVDSQSVEPIAGMLAPVPGGVGPVTVACLLENVFQVARLKK
ncbi:MAG: bifunctional 5,10-methylenetetrahydrofolate dehydrogenase/5,10-methenyltetrahydrofolate cyclohydrolase [Candidatus Doudnabacteria bacterium]|nr:bifunctional 5,10-methylenetetrahydrofolate dehydrogenase/5,10-methenyltetrahydrofolate cyclohydrolase [Candidatus Doudnabacteria bacterium]